MRSFRQLGLAPLLTWASHQLKRKNDLLPSYCCNKGDSKIHEKSENPPTNDHHCKSVSIFPPGGGAGVLCDDGFAKMVCSITFSRCLGQFARFGRFAQGPSFDQSLPFLFEKPAKAPRRTSKLEKTAWLRGVPLCCNKSGATKSLARSLNQWKLIWKTCGSGARSAAASFEARELAHGSTCCNCSIIVVLQISYNSFLMYLSFRRGSKS